MHAKPYKSSKSERMTIEYGFSYRRLRDNAEFSLENKIPKILVDFYEAVADSLVTVGNVLLDEKFDTCLVNLYKSNVDLFPHVDKCQQHAIENKYNYYVGENILGVTLISDKVGSLYLQNTENTNPKEIFALPENDGMVYLLSNEYRHFPWHHGVSTVSSLRLSATFRTLYKTNGNERMYIPSNHYID